MTEIERILDQLERAFGGEAWFGNSLRETLFDVTAEKAVVRLFPKALNIWEIVLHITFTEEIMRRRIEGERAAFSDSEDFPAIQETSETAWRQTLENLESSHRKLKDLINCLDETQLNDLVAEQQYSNYFLLHGLIQHLVYHTGQIALLKKALNR